MTKKDYELVANSISRVRATYSNAPAVQAAIRHLAEALSADMLAASKFNMNGNKSFKPDVFLKACGL